MWTNPIPNAPIFPVRFCCLYICALLSVQKQLKKQDNTLRTQSATQTWLNKVKLKLLQIQTRTERVGAHLSELPAGGTVGWVALLIWACTFSCFLFACIYISIPTLLKSSTGTHPKGTWADVQHNDGRYKPFIFQKCDTLGKGFDHILCKAYKQTGLSLAWYLITLSFLKN